MDQTVPRTASFFTQNVIANCTANSVASTTASLTRRSEGLSRVSWKLSRTVLRGAVGGNAARLLDQDVKKGKKPKYEFLLPGREPFGMAAVWKLWKNPKIDKWERTFAVLTGSPNELMQPVHPRMTTFLEPRDYAEYLTPAERPPVHLLRILACE